MILKSNTNMARNMKKILLGVFCALLPFGTYAETPSAKNQDWIGPFTITKVARYWDGAFRLTIHVKEVPETPCSLNNTNKAFTTHSNVNDDLVAQMMGLSATAEAQNKKIRLLTASPCDNNYGLNFYGIELISE